MVLMGFAACWYQVTVFRITPPRSERGQGGNNMEMIQQKVAREWLGLGRGRRLARKRQGEVRTIWGSNRQDSRRVVRFKWRSWAGWSFWISNKTGNQFQGLC